MSSESKEEKKQTVKPQTKAKSGTRQRQVKLSLEEFEALKEKEKLAENYYDRLLRLQAEFENYKKRIAREKQEFVKFANEELIVEILPVVDSLERALDGAHNSPNASSIREGVELIRKQLLQTLKKFGVERIESIGKQFDPHQHEVIMQVESEEYPEGTVIEELQKGYMLNQRLIRPAVVKISTGKSKPAEFQEITRQNEDIENREEYKIEAEKKDEEVKETKENTNTISNSE